MHGFLLVLSLHFSDEHRGGDRWFAADKAKHFFTAAFVQSGAYGGLRYLGASRSASLAGASAIGASVSIGKEVYDSRSGGSASAKDLTWDAAGMIAASMLLHRTTP
jgi:putative lipoprotein